MKLSPFPLDGYHRGTGCNVVWPDCSSQTMDERRIAISAAIAIYLLPIGVETTTSDLHKLSQETLAN